MDLKTLKLVLKQLNEERGIPKEKIVETIEDAIATAYKKEYGKKNQIIRAKFDLDTGKTEFYQEKTVVDDSMLKKDEENKKNEVEKDEKIGEESSTLDEEVKKVKFNPERHIMIEDARKIKKSVKPGDKITFPLEAQKDYGRIAAQTGKQVIIQRIREAEKEAIYNEYKNKQNEVVSGIIQRIENGNIFVDLGITTAVLPRDEQVRGERYRIGERIKALIFLVEYNPKGVNVYLSRTHPKFLTKLFELEVPEIASGVVEIKELAREAGSRSKVAVVSHETEIDPVGSCVGQRGVRISTIIAELGGEKVDIVEWSEKPEEFIANALSPAKVLEVNIKPSKKEAKVIIAEDQVSLAIGKRGQNVRLAAKLTGWKLDIESRTGESIAQATKEGEVKGEGIEPDNY
jgi:N utilization substance protein A